MKKELSAWQKFQTLPTSQKIRLMSVSALLLIMSLLVLVALVISLNEPQPISFDDALRRQLVEGKSQKISFLCEAVNDTNERVIVEVEFFGFKDKETALVNGLEVTNGYQLNVMPKQCTNYYRVGIIEIQGNKVYLNAVRPEPITPPFQNQ